MSSSWPTGLLPDDEVCGACHERGTFGVATTITRVNGIDPEWGANKGGEVWVLPGGAVEIEWRTTGLGHDYGETAGFVIVPNTTHWQVAPHRVRDHGREWDVPWMIASSDEKGVAHDNTRTWVTAYEHVHRAGDDGFPGGRGYGSDKDDGSALDLNGVPHDEYLGARVRAPTAPGAYSVSFGAAGMPETLVNKASWVAVALKVGAFAPPTVVGTSPASGAAGVSVVDPIVVAFDRPMDRASTESAFSLSPAALGTLTWDGDRTNLTFTPDSILEFATSYELAVGTDARDRSGIPVASAASATFTTQPKPPFTVFLSSPRGGELLRGRSAFDITGTVLGGTPPYVATILLSTDSGSSFPVEIAVLALPQAGPFSATWSVGTVDSATVRVGARVRDSAGAEVLGQSRDLEVDSRGPRVAGTFPAAGETNVSRFSPIVVGFSEPMDPATAEASLSVDPPAPGALSWDGPNLTLQPGELLYGSADYSVRVAGTATDLVGNPLVAPAEAKFRTEKDWSVPKVVSRTPSGAGASAYASVVVRFSKLMLRNATEGAFSISPPVPGAISWEQATMTFSPLDGLRYSTRYTVSVTTAAEDLVGLHPDANETWEFEVIPPTPPSLVARTPGGADIDVNQTIDATFSDHMDPAATLAAFSISPPADLGSWWVGKRTLRFAPDGPLSGRTTYTAGFSTLARNTRGIALAAPAEWNFTTGVGRDTIPPGVVHVQPDPVLDVQRLNVTLAVEDNVGVTSVVIRHRTAPSSGFVDRPMDLFSGTEREGAFRAEFEAPLRPQLLEYELVVSDGDNTVFLPGGGGLFSVRFVASEDRSFALLALLTFAGLAPVVSYAAIHALRMGSPRARTASSRRSPGRSSGRR